jgi:hypothetical protein
MIVSSRARNSGGTALYMRLSRRRAHRTSTSAGQGDNGLGVGCGQPRSRLSAKLNMFGWAVSHGVVSVGR